jgi:hypothetical protein
MHHQAARPATSIHDDSIASGEGRAERIKNEAVQSAIPPKVAFHLRHLRILLRSIQHTLIPPL